MRKTKADLTNTVKDLIRIEKETLGDRDYYKRKYVQMLLNLDHNKWSLEDIIAWVINLDEHRYEKYENRLFEGMKKEGVDGSRLKDIKQDDLYRFGIQSIHDKNDIFQAIQNLIQRKM